MDTYRHKGLRKKMVSKIRDKGISSDSVLEAISRVPRHLFLDRAFEEKAYLDIAFRIDCDQTISQPFTVAKQTELLDISEGDKVLEIGTGSGYQAAVLLELGAEVYSVERHKALHERTRSLLYSLGYENAHLRYGDGMLGWEEHAPYEKIVVTAAFDTIPEKLLEQLAIGGVIVMPVGDYGEAQKMIRVEKLADGMQKSYHGEFRFVPLLSGKE